MLCGGCPEDQGNLSTKFRVVKPFVLSYNGTMHSEIKLLETLTKKKLTLAIAESCTGGLLSNRITNIPGSSKVFLLGTITYSNESKNKVLKVPAKIIQTKGAVSPEAALAMAKGIRELAHASFGLGITGIAGPGASTKEKPIGTVFIGLSSSKKLIAREFHFRGNRLEIKRMATEEAIRMLLDFVQ